MSGCTAHNPPTETTTATTESSTPVSVTTTQLTTVDPHNHTVTVTRRISHGQTGLTRVLYVADGGHLEYTLICADGTTETAATELAADRWLAFERLVLTTDLAVFASEYDCRGDCPHDFPPTHLTIEVDGDVTEVLIEATAEVPSELDALLTELESFEDCLELPLCK